MEYVSYRGMFAHFWNNKKNSHYTIQFSSSRLALFYKKDVLKIDTKLSAPKSNKVVSFQASYWKDRGVFSRVLRSF